MDKEAERRRQALKRFMQTHKLTRGRLARQANLSPNVIYNFFKGKSGYLSQPSLEKIAETYGVTIASIIGEAPAPAPRPASAAAEADASVFQGYEGSASARPVSLPLSGVAMGPGIWSEAIFVKPEQQEEIFFSVPSYYQGKVFAAKMMGATMDEAFPSGSVFACVPVKDYLQRIAGGDIVVVVRRNKLGLFETAFKRYLIEGDRHFLVSQPRDAALREKLVLKSPLADPAALGHQDFFIHAVALYYAAHLPASRR